MYVFYFYLEIVSVQFEICAFPNTEKAKGTELQFRPIYLERKLLTTPRTSSFSDLNTDKKPSPLTDVVWTLIQLLKLAQRRWELNCRSFCETPPSPVPLLTTATNGRAGLCSSGFSKDVFLNNVL